MTLYPILLIILIVLLILSAILIATSSFLLSYGDRKLIKKGGNIQYAEISNNWENLCSHLKNTIISTNLESYKDSPLYKYIIKVYGPIISSSSPYTITNYRGNKNNNAIKFRRSIAAYRRKRGETGTPEEEAAELTQIAEEEAAKTLAAKTLAEEAEAKRLEEEAEVKRLEEVAEVKRLEEVAEAATAKIAVVAAEKESIVDNLIDDGAGLSTTGTAADTTLLTSLESAKLPNYLNDEVGIFKIILEMILNLTTDSSHIIQLYIIFVLRYGISIEEMTSQLSIEKFINVLNDGYLYTTKSTKLDESEIQNNGEISDHLSNFMFNIIHYAYIDAGGQTNGEQFELLKELNLIVTKRKEQGPMNFSEPLGMIEGFQRNLSTTIHFDEIMSDMDDDVDDVDDASLTYFDSFGAHLGDGNDFNFDEPIYFDNDADDADDADDDDAHQFNIINALPTVEGEEYSSMQENMSSNGVKLKTPQFTSLLLSGKAYSPLIIPSGSKVTAPPNFKNSISTSQSDQLTLSSPTSTSPRTSTSPAPSSGSSIRSTSSLRTGTPTSLSRPGTPPPASKRTLVVSNPEIDNALVELINYLTSNSQILSIYDTRANFQNKRAIIDFCEKRQKQLADLVSEICGTSAVINLKNIYIIIGKKHSSAPTVKKDSFKKSSNYLRVKRLFNKLGNNIVALLAKVTRILPPTTVSTTPAAMPYNKSNYDAIINMQNAALKTARDSATHIPTYNNLITANYKKAKLERQKLNDVSSKPKNKYKKATGSFNASNLM